MTIKDAAWQHRPDVVDVDWKEICDRYDVQKAVHTSRRVSIACAVIIAGLCIWAIDVLWSVQP